MIWWALQNSLIAAALIVIVLLIARLGKPRPALLHGLWLVVLLKFLTPTLVAWPWSPTAALLALDSIATQPIAPDSRDELSRAGDEMLPSSQYPANDGIHGAMSSVDTPVSASADRELTVDDRNEANGDRATDELADTIHRAQLSDAQVGGTTLVPAPVGRGEQMNTTDADSSPRLDSSIATPTGSPLPHLPDGIIASGESEPHAILHAPRRNIARYVQEYASTILLPVWLFGVALTGLWQLMRIARCQRCSVAGRPAPQWLDREVARLSTVFRLRSPRALVVPGIGSPSVWCLGSPKLLWPAALLTDEGERHEQWRSVIAHELAHLLRHDHWVAWLELVASCMWWWNPLLWYVLRRLHENAELACDAWAVWATPEQRRDYAETLVEVSRLASQTRAPLPVLAASSGARSAFQRRLTMILCEQVPRKVSFRGFILIGLVAIMAIPGLARGQQTSPRPRGSSPLADESPPISDESPSGSTPQKSGEEKPEALLRSSGRQRRTVRGDLTGAPAPNDERMFQSFALQHAQAREMQRVLTELLDGDFKISSDTRSNSVLIRGTARELAEAEAIIRRLDVPLDKETSLEPKQEGNVIERQGQMETLTSRLRGAELPKASGGVSQLPASQTVSAGNQLDLVTLGTAYIDSIGTLKLAQHTAARMSQLANSKAISSEELHNAEVNLETAERKTKLLQRIAEAAYTSAQIELDFAKKMTDKGYMSSSNLANAETKVKILQLILQKEQE